MCKIILLFKIKYRVLFCAIVWRCAVRYFSLCVFVIYVTLIYAFISIIPHPQCLVHEVHTLRTQNTQFRRLCIHYSTTSEHDIFCRLFSLIARASILFWLFSYFVFDTSSTQYFYLENKLQLNYVYTKQEHV